MTATDIVMSVLGGQRVLVVENNEDTATTLTAMLRLNGFDARCTRTGAEGLQAVVAFRPCAVLIDLDLPDADGCAIIRRIRAASRPPAVVVLTAHTDLGHLRAAAEAGATEYLLKPAEPVDLVRLLTRLCHPTDAKD